MSRGTIITKSGFITKIDQLGQPFVVFLRILLDDMLAFKLTEGNLDQYSGIPVGIMKNKMQEVYGKKFDQVEDMFWTCQFFDLIEPISYLGVIVLTKEGIKFLEEREEEDGTHN